MTDKPLDLDVERIERRREYVCKHRLAHLDAGSFYLIRDSIPALLAALKEARGDAEAEAYTSASALKQRDEARAERDAYQHSAEVTHDELREALAENERLQATLEAARAGRDALAAQAQQLGWDLQGAIQRAEEAERELADERWARGIIEESIRSVGATITEHDGGMGQSPSRTRRKPHVWWPSAGGAEIALRQRAEAAEAEVARAQREAAAVRRSYLHEQAQREAAEQERDRLADALRQIIPLVENERGETCDSEPGVCWAHSITRIARAALEQR